jgi:signal transduction histidine kinase
MPEPTPPVFRHWPSLLIGILAGLAGSAFFIYDALDEGGYTVLLTELSSWEEWIEAGFFGPVLGFLCYVISLRYRHKQATLRRELELAHREHLLHLGHLVAGIAHETRNPLHNMRLIVEQLTTAPDDPERILKHGERLKVNLDRIERAVELIYEQARPDLLDDVMVFDLRRVIDEACEEIAGLRLTWQERNPAIAPMVSNSRPALFLILVNLLRNAVAAADGRVSIALQVDVRNIHLTLINAGTLTTPRNDHDTGGLGVGLYLCRLLIARCAGSLELLQQDDEVHARVVLPRWGETLP